MLEHSLIQALIYLGAAALFVPIFIRVGLGAVLGYLVAGIAIGPWGIGQYSGGFGLIEQKDLVGEVSELGVVLLMFLVGLDLNPQRLWAMRRQIFGLGTLQVGLTIAATACLLRAFGVQWAPSLTLGMAAAMSSTAIAIQLLTERRLMLAPSGQASFGVALFQDIAVVPLLLIVALLSTDSVNATPGLPAWRQIATAVGLIAAMIAGGRLFLRPLFRWIAAIGLREIFLCFALLLVVGSALLTESIGLSMAMGAFIAGLLLADSEYRMELEVDIDPLKGLFLGLFFMSVGMSLDIGQLLRQPGLIVGMALLIVAIKISVMRTLGFVFEVQRENGWLFALSLSQVGEFAFVLLSAGATAKVLDAEQIAIARSVVALSMLTTPLMFLAYDRWIAPLYSRQQAERDPDRIEERRPLIVVGIGRFGQMVVRLLRARNIEATIIDLDPAQIAAVARFGWRTHYGDGSRIDVIEGAGVAQARLIVLAFDQPGQVLSAATHLRQRYPKLKILARARGRLEAIELERIGVTAIRETLGSAIETGERALVELGEDAIDAARFAERFREHDDALLLQMVAANDDEQRRQIYDAGRARFMQILQAEEQENRAQRYRREGKRSDVEIAPAEAANEH